MTTHLDLSGRSVLLTGASGAIGSHIAAELASCGARVVGTYRTHRADAERALSEAEHHTVLQATLDSPESARDLWHRAEAWHSLDTLVVNAAAMAHTPLRGDEQAAWDAGWQLSLQVNVIAAATLMRQAAEAFAERGFGTIVAISSWAAEQGSRIPDAASYAASKAALRNFAQTLARANTRTGVRVYTIAPGVVDGGMGTSGQNVDEVAAVAEGLAMGRHVDPQEIAALTSFLASDCCPSLTGSTLDLNGASYIR